MRTPALPPADEPGYEQRANSAQSDAYSANIMWVLGPCSCARGWMHGWREQLASLLSYLYLGEPWGARSAF